MAPKIRPAPRRHSPFLLAALWALFGAACARPLLRQPPLPAEAPLETPVPVEAAPGAAAVALVWMPSPQDDPLASAEFLEARPHLKVTAVLPDRFFTEEEKSWRAWQIFQGLMARGQAEVVLALPHAPPLALLQDTDLAKISTGTIPSLPPRYAWPDDVAGQLAIAQSQYRKRWRADPQALVMPGGVLAGPEILFLTRLHLKWVLAMEGPGEPGCFGGIPVKVARPLPFPGAFRSAQDWWAAWRARQGLSASSAAQDALALLPPVRILSLGDLSAFVEWAEKLGGVSWVLVSEKLASAENWPAWPGPELEPPDFSPWIGEPEENLAWQLLGATRQALEDYKNSGQANLRHLDLALRELYNAESGRYFYYFGNDFNSGQDGALELEFMATLAQVYRLMGQPVPGHLLQGFAAASSGPQDEAGDTSFQRVGDTLRWRDAAGDDRGPGDFFYPSGAHFPPGSWDLLTFQVRAREAEVSFQFEMAALPNPWVGPAGFSLPLVDTYMDINQLPGAGEETLLPGRGGLVEPQKAWEYALSVDGWGARLYQYSPGAPPKKLGRFPVKPGSAPHSFRVDVPRRLLRGSPESWSFGVVVMGRDPDGSPAEGEGRPLKVLPEPGPRNFGGAWTGTAQAASGREAPPFLDLLTPRGQRQSEVLGVYKQGRDVVIPLLRPE